LVPSVFGGDKETAWALPSVLYAGNGVGFVFIPPIGTNVGIELVIQILLSGLAAFWESGKAPIVPDIPDRKVIKTCTATISINDLSEVEGEAIRIETITGLKLIMNSQGIEGLLSHD
jgi:Type VI secretion system/phage-baseplate injector OB domain